jgi:hypothetical protein
LAWANGELAASSWAEGYARLVRGAGYSQRIGRQAGAGLAAVERGEASTTPTARINMAAQLARFNFIPAPKPSEWMEGAAIVVGQDHQRHSRLFFEFLDATGRAERPPATMRSDDMTDTLLADLLGATLVDAQDELWTAWDTMARAGEPPRALMWLTQAPPWPPASIEKLEKDHSEALIQTLVEQVAPDPDLRAWLLRSWLGPKRLVDESLLEEIGRAADGRLAREPRFRAWLRAEWTAWARQRYRRVTRTVKGLRP